MSEGKRINHVVKALRESEFYPKDAPAKPGEINDVVLKAILDGFLQCKGKPEDIRRVINAFRTIDEPTFRGITSTCDVITITVHKATEKWLNFHLQKQVRKPFSWMNLNTIINSQVPETELLE